MKKLIKKSHLKFIELIVNGKDQDEAYKLTVGKQGLTDASARVKGSILAKRYATEIQQARQKQQEAIQQAGVNKLVQETLKSILMQSEVDAKLCQIINGTLETEKILGFDEKTNKVRKAICKPSALEIAKAIDLYNKRFGSNAPVKTDTTVTVTDLTITRKVIGNGNTS